MIYNAEAVKARQSFDVEPRLNRTDLAHQVSYASAVHHINVILRGAGRHVKAKRNNQ
jgi:hypothetical protein